MVKSCISVNDTITDYIVLCMQYWSETGRKASPLLFAIFSNDLENYFSSNDIKGLQL